MNQRERLRETEPDYQHRGCGAVVSVGAYGDWHFCEACEVATDQHHHRPRQSICARVNA